MAHPQANFERANSESHSLEAQNSNKTLFLSFTQIGFFGRDEFQGSNGIWRAATVVDWVWNWPKLVMVERWGSFSRIDGKKQKVLSRSKFFFFLKNIHETNSPGAHRGRHRSQMNHKSARIASRHFPVLTPHFKSFRKADIVIHSAFCRNDSAIGDPTVVTSARLPLSWWRIIGERAKFCRRNNKPTFVQVHKRHNPERQALKIKYQSNHNISNERKRNWRELTLWLKIIRKYCQLSFVTDHLSGQVNSFQS